MKTLQYNDKEMAFLRIICSSEHKHITQDSVRQRLVDAEVIAPEEFNAIKKKLLYSGVIGVVYGNITLEKPEIAELFRDDASI